MVKGLNLDNVITMKNIVAMIIKMSHDENSGITIPSVFINSTQTAPLLLPPSSSNNAPTARSLTPSPSRSPIFATVTPNWSELLRIPLKPPWVSEIFCSDFIVPSEFRNNV